MSNETIHLADLVELCVKVAVTTNPIGLADRRGVPIREPSTGLEP